MRGLLIIVLGLAMVPAANAQGHAARRNGGSGHPVWHGTAPRANPGMIAPMPRVPSRPAPMNRPMLIAPGGRGFATPGSRGGIIGSHGHAPIAPRPFRPYPGQHPRLIVPPPVYVPSPAYGSYGFFPRSSFGYPYGYPYYSYPYMFDPFYATPFPSSEYPFNTYYYNPGAGSYSSQANSVLVSPNTAESDSAEAQPSPDSKPQITVLVFRDGHRIEVRDYAIAGDTLWILTEQRATKVPLSDLDLDQTIQVNQEHGIRFPVAPAAQQP